LDKSLAQLSADEWMNPGIVGSWNAKDLLAHLTAWEGFLRDWYICGLQKKTSKIPAPGYSWTEINRLNEDIYRRNQDRSLDEIQAEYLASYQETFALVQSIPQADLYTPGRFAWTGTVLLEGYVTANTSNHYRWARSKLRLWQKTNQTQPDISRSNN
jgi:hypothetical protein